MEFNQEDYKNTAVFLTRTDLKGNESMIHAVLMQKINSILQEFNAQKPEVKVVEQKDKKDKK